MIVADLKPFEELNKAVAEYKRIVLVGCGTCTTVSLTGGERQVELLATALRLARKVAGGALETTETTIQRQCEPEFVEALKDAVGRADAVLSLGCGAGVQLIADALAPLPVVPALNTSFIGVAKEHALWEERCAACGDCVLGSTGGICPVARCAKGILNGPCGGTNDGRCEVGDAPCAWTLIYERLSEQGKLSDFETIAPPKDHSRATGPRSLDLREVSVED
ncbi:MAG: methylenetetrahydrofolate reductase C-terminal domain-containing protein [Candidatus Aquicultorales bacterium]